MQILESVAIAAALILVLTWFLWPMYLAVMHMKKVRDQQGGLPWVAYVLGMPALIVGLILDVVYNLVAGTILFLELPRELLFTSRLQRHMTDDNWRGDLAIWFCDNLLDPYDPGGHC